MEGGGDIGKWGAKGILNVYEKLYENYNLVAQVKKHN